MSEHTHTPPGNGFTEKWHRFDDDHSGPDLDLQVYVPPEAYDDAVCEDAGPVMDYEVDTAHDDVIVEASKRTYTTVCGFIDDEHDRVPASEVPGQ